jgi:hypothetical protein
MAVLFALLLGIAIVTRNALEIFVTGGNFLIGASMAFYFSRKEKTKNESKMTKLPDGS